MKRCEFCDNLAVDPDGTKYLIDKYHEGGLLNLMLDIVESIKQGYGITIILHRNKL